MIRERVARTALQAFPREVRAARGEEMVGTLLDTSASSRVRFAREIVDLVRAGLRARALVTAQVGAGRVVADGVCLAAVWMLTLFLSSDLGLRIHGGEPGYPDEPIALWSLALLGSALALALVGYDRIAGAMALCFTASLVVHTDGAGLTNGSRGPLLVATLCFCLLVLAPRRRRPDPRRLAWLALPGVLAVVSSASDDPTAMVLLLARLSPRSSRARAALDRPSAGDRMCPAGDRLRHPDRAQPRKPEPTRSARDCRDPRFCAAGTRDRGDADAAPASARPRLTALTSRRPRRSRGPDGAGRSGTRRPPAAT